MKIWVIGRSYPTRGNKMRGSFELEQARILADAGNEVTYIAAVFHPLNKVKKWGKCSFLDGNIPVYVNSVFYTPDRIRLHLKGFQCRVWRDLLAWVEDEQGIPDVIHVHYPGMVSIPDAVLTYQEKGTAVVITDHWSRTLKNTMDSFQRNQLIQYVNDADAVLCVSQPMKTSIQMITKSDKEIQVVPNVVSGLFRYEPKTDCRYFRFIAVGRLVPTKQMDQIIKAFGETFKGMEQISLTVVGGGEEMKKLQELVSSYQIQSQVELTGSLTREETAAKIMQADALVCYSRLETFGVPIIEAWACGKPVIETDVVNQNLGSFGEWDEKLGLVVPCDNIEMLKTAMKRLYSERDKFDSAAIANFVQERFGEKIICETLMTIYRNVVKAKTSQKGE